MEAVMTEPSPASLLLADGRLVVRSGARTTFLNLDDVLFFEGARNYLLAHTTEGVVRFRAKIGDVEATLPDEGFARIHRSYIVNVSRVRSIRPWSSGDQIVTLNTGRELRLSRTFRERATRLGIPR